MTRVIADFADRVRKLARAAGTQTKLAKVVGVTKGAVTGWLGTTRPYDSTIADICAKTGVSREWLVEGKGNEEEELRRFTERLDTQRALLGGASVREESMSPGARDPQDMEHFYPSELDAGLSRVVDLFAAHTDASQLTHILDDLLAARDIPPSLRLRLSNRIDQHIRLHRRPRKTGKN